MRVSGKRQGIDNWSNVWSCSTYFLRRNIKCEKKWEEVNKDNSLTHFTFYILLFIYKREEAEIRHEPSWYEKEQLPSLTSTHIVFFREVHVKHVSGPPVTSKVNEHNIRFPRDEEGNVDVKNGEYDTNNQQKNATFNYEQEGRFCLGAAKIEGKNGTITGKRCPVFDYTGKNIVTIDVYKKETLKEFERVRKLTSSSSQWIKKKYRQGMALRICR